MTSHSPETAVAGESLPSMIPIVLLEMYKRMHTKLLSHDDDVYVVLGLNMIQTVFCSLVIGGKTRTKMRIQR